MKRLLIITFSVLLIIACKEANELEIVPSAPDGTGASDLPLVTSINPNNGSQMIDQNTSVAGIQGRMIVTFSDFMDAATMSESNIEILNTSTGGSQLSGFTVQYFPEIKRIFVDIDNVDSAGAFLVRLVSGGMTNTYGSPLDFDQDNENDGSPYDDYLSTFWTTSYTDTLVNTNVVNITNILPDSSRIVVQDPIIRVDFNMNMDTTTLNTANITLKNESGTSQTLNVVSKTLTRIDLQPASLLAMSENYYVTVKCANIQRIGDSQTPNYMLVLDGDDDGPEATEPDFEWYFRVDTIAPPTVGVAYLGYARFTFSRLIDESTITAANIRVHDSKGYIPGSFRIHYNSTHTYTMVDYHFKRSFSGTRYGFVSKDVQAENGYFLDGNGNGIGGEPGDNYYHSF